MSLKRVVALNPDNWQKALQKTLSKFSEFDGTKLVLDEPNSFQDLLRFDVIGFRDTITSEITNELQRAFAGLVSISYEFNPQNTREKLVSVKVVRPQSNVLDRVMKLHDKYLSRIAWKGWNLWLLGTVMTVDFMLIIHACYLLNEHTALKSDSFSLLLHFITHKFAGMFLSLSQ